METGKLTHVYYLCAYQLQIHALMGHASVILGPR